MGTGKSEAGDWVDARAGSSAAFAAIFDEHRDRVFGHALRLLLDPHDAEDVTALVFLETWRRREVVRVVDGSVIGWLLVTTNNVVHNLTRSKRRYRGLLGQLAVPSPDETSDDPASTIEERISQAARDAKVRAAFTRLSRTDQDVITLCVLEEHTQAQAARVLGVPQGTVKSRLSRAKQKLSAHAVDEFGTRANIFGGEI